MCTICSWSGKAYMYMYSCTCIAIHCCTCTCTAAMRVSSTIEQPWECLALLLAWLLWVDLIFRCTACLLVDDYLYTWVLINRCILVLLLWGSALLLVLLMVQVPSASHKVSHKLEWSYYSSFLRIAFFFYQSLTLCKLFVSPALHLKALGGILKIISY
jgi:hypothetical protein